MPILQAFSKQIWWTLRDSNPWPPPRQGGALPTELSVRMNNYTRYFIKHNYFIDNHSLTKTTGNASPVVWTILVSLHAASRGLVIWDNYLCYSSIRFLFDCKYLTPSQRARPCLCCRSVLHRILLLISWLPLIDRWSQVNEGLRNFFQNLLHY